jgi:hypothetical protein
MPELVRDEELEQELLSAVLAAQGRRPRDKQIELGPSGVGGCREYIRATMAGDPRLPEVEWKAEAWIGTIGGDALEEIFEQELGALVQQRITTTLPRTGLVVSGNLLHDGPSLEHLIQVSVYVLGLVQQGVLDKGASARLIYWDRSGTTKSFLAAVIEWDAILRFIDLCEQRLEQVVEAQEALDEGDLTYRHFLRDKKPAYCASPKVMCPFRQACWGGSDWWPDGKIEDAELVAAAERVYAGRQMQKAGEELVRIAKAELDGINGTTPTGLSVGWSGTRLNVTRVGVPDPEPLNARQEGTSRG